MIDTATAKASFWSSKVGHAALASIAAMTLMVLLSSQIQPGAASAAPMAHPVGTAGTVIEIA
ncbi:hypothetical protein ACLBKU_14225 [Erythrobacter sp. NE805]|uniref:hypothetical protein n=1 Tax=Erythrobacter sp. NE805 TaxID=3389875 RepID=UPI00396B2AE0